MRMIITKEDIDRYVIGRFIVRLTCGSEENKDISTSKDAFFWLEKRISFVSANSQNFITMSGFFSESRKPMTEEDFVTMFNGNGESCFFRLLTSKELDWLLDQMKNRNY